MGIVPPPLILFRGRRQETKDERPPLQGYGDQLEGYSDKESNPPQGGSVIAHPLLKRPSNPELDVVYGKPPRPRVDRRLIGDYYL